jgi:hypothetical protein
VIAAAPDDGSESPPPKFTVPIVGELFALTLHSYVVDSSKPVTVIGDDIPVAVFVDPPDIVQVTVYVTFTPEPAVVKFEKGTVTEVPETVTDPIAGTFGSVRTDLISPKAVV